MQAAKPMLVNTAGVVTFQAAVAIAKPSKRGVKDWPDKKKELRSSHHQLVPYGSKLILGVKLKPTSMYCEQHIQVKDYY